MASPKEIELCQEIIAASIRVNDQGSHSVFVSFRGHINSLNVEYGPPWHDGDDYKKTADIYVRLSSAPDAWSSPEISTSNLEKIKSKIESLLDVNADGVSV